MSVSQRWPCQMIAMAFTDSDSARSPVSAEPANVSQCEWYYSCLQQLVQSPMKPVRMCLLFITVCQATDQKQEQMPLTQIHRAWHWWKTGGECVYVWLRNIESTLKLAISHKRCIFLFLFILVVDLNHITHNGAVCKSFHIFKVPWI